MYADILTNPSSTFASQFEDDDFRATVQEQTKSVDQAMKLNEGTQKQVFTYDKANIKVMQSTDGGDLVVAQIDSTWNRNAGGGRQSLPASDSEEVLFGKSTPTSKISVSYINVVAIYVPPVDSSGKIRVIGAERQPVKAVALK